MTGLIKMMIDQVEVRRDLHTKRAGRSRGESQNWEETQREGHEFVILRKGTKPHDRAKTRNMG